MIKSIFETFGHSIRNYFNFSGRASKGEVWIFTAGNSLLELVILLIQLGLGNIMKLCDSESTISLVLAFAILGLQLIMRLWALFILIPSISLTVRRLHDTEKSAWYLLWLLVPIIGYILVFASLYMSSGSFQDNIYGPSSDII